MLRPSLGVLFCVGVWGTLAIGQQPAPDGATDLQKEQELVTSIRQITFEGRRSGEGYFSGDGNRMVFQSERDPANPFYQIYLNDLLTGDIERVSTGQGKTTCAWIAPDGKQVLFASSHDDEQAVQKQNDELEFRLSGKTRRYAWDYDENYELYSRDLESGELTRLTNSLGYDAEGSYSPDGKQIVFVSNRAAYTRQLTERETLLFEKDQAFMIDLYIMDADGSNVRRLTDVAGYDGGPFFSADGQRICWRRFSENGLTAEIFSMKTDGTDVQRLTNLGNMSWAPYYHPSGQYLIFATNKHGFKNFELYMVRADGQRQPVRVTYWDGFDALPVFLPDGKRLSWTSHRNPLKQSQIYLADWNHAEALRKLGLDEESSSAATTHDGAIDGETDQEIAREAVRRSKAGFEPTDIVRHVDYLTRSDLGGRLTGTPGEKRATAYVAAYLQSLGFEPAGEDGTYFQQFDFPSGASIADGNTLKLDHQPIELQRDWVPLSFSGNQTLPETNVVFAGYGMQIPASENSDPYDSYVHLDVKDQWVMVFRDIPQEITPERRQKMARYGSPRRKATIARDLGAKGILFVAGPTSKVRSQLIRFNRDASQAGASIAAVSISNTVAERLLEGSGKTLLELQQKLDDGSQSIGFTLPDKKVSATVAIKRNRGVGRNVIARLPAEQASDDNAAVMIGAHIDHLGRGGGSNSLAGEEERDQIHVGADDNASGVAAMLEIAQFLASEKRGGRLHSRRDLLIAAWSGEELGLFGSQAYAERFFELNPNAKHTQEDSPSKTPVLAHGVSPDSEPLTAAIGIYLNLDMVGRLREKLIIQGIGSSPTLAGNVQRRNVPIGLTLELDNASTNLPTDASAFVSRQVPILSAFTGAHEDYHTPRDTPEKLNYDGASQIANLFGLIARGYLLADRPPIFELDQSAGQQEEAPRANLTASLGTIPDYGAGNIKGVKLGGVRPDFPAQIAGIQGGDIVVELAGKKIEDIYDYTYAIEALKIGQEVEIIVIRKEKRVSMKITPVARN